MDIRVLRYFLAVAREENITRAAESLHMAQPSLSKQMMELEQELGKQLLVRGKRKVSLTKDGVLLRKRADEIVSLFEKTERELQMDAEILQGEISIGGSINFPIILDTMADFRKQYEQIQFQIFHGDATDVTERLDHGSLDFAILIDPIDTKKYNYIPLPYHAFWGVLMKKENPYTEKDVVTKDQLLQMPLVFHKRAGLQRTIANWAQEEIDHFHIVTTYNIFGGDPHQFVKHDIGNVLLISHQVDISHEESLCFKPLHPALDVPYVLAWKRYGTLNPASDAFLKALTKQIEKNQ